MSSDEQILAELMRASAGLYYLSESDYPFEPVRLEGTGEPQSERLRELAGMGADAPVEMSSLEKFFRSGTAVQMSREGVEEAPRAASFQNVVRTLREHLTDIRVYRIGERNIPVYILGRSGSGHWLGLTTRIVET